MAFRRRMRRRNFRSRGRGRGRFRRRGYPARRRRSYMIIGRRL